MNGTIEKKPDKVISILCSNCGASNELQSLTPEMTCQHCGHLEKVDPTLLSELSAHDNEVDSHLIQIDVELDEAAYWNKTAKQAKESTTRKGWLAPILAMVVFPIIPTMIFLILSALGVIGEDNIFYSPFVYVASTSLGFIIYFIWYFSRSHKKTVDREETFCSVIHCPQCGATNQFQLGEVTDNCSYCGTLLIPDASVRQNMVDAAIGQKRRAEMETLRAERKFNVSMKRASVGAVGMTLWIGSFFTFAVFFGAAVRSYLIIVGREYYSPNILVHWLSGFVVLGAVFLAADVLKRRQKRVTNAVDALAKSFNGRGLNSKGIIDWLNSYWPSPINMMDMIPGKWHCGGSFVLGGYPVLVDLNPKPLTTRHKSWARIFISCFIPGLADGAAQLGDEGKPIKEQIHTAGYSYRQREAGFLFLASDDIVKGLQNPQNIAKLATPITTMVRFANAHDAIPAQKIP